MTAAKPRDIDSPDTGASDDIAAPSVANEVACSGCPGDAATDGTAIDEETLLRIANVPRDVGWMMVTVGVLGVILPGIVGTPFLVAGIAVLVYRRDHSA